MEILDKVSKTLSDTGQKAKNAADIAALNSNISNNKRQLQKLYAQLGEQYYNTHHENPEPAFQDLTDQILSLQDEINDWNDQIQQLKGYIKCPGCGEYVDASELSCPHCGHSLLPEGAVVCPQCGAVITEPDVIFCQYCGASLNSNPGPEQTVIQEPGPIQCKCGAILDKNAKFCPNCGISREELEQMQHQAE